MDFIIEVKNLSKKYKIYHQIEKYRTLVDEIVKTFKEPLHWLRDEGRSKEDFWAIRAVSFNVKPGEIIGIIGLNGAGKSTLLKVLTRITSPSEGEAIIRGRVGSLLEVGTGFHPELTGRDNVYISGIILGMTRKEINKNFDEIVEFAGVEKFIDMPVKRYSSGMAVRLAFAIAAHLEPEILLVDEVLAVGDAEFQKRSIRKMEEVSRKGKTVLFVSHNMASILNLCPRSILLDSGRVVMDGPTSSVVEFYMGWKKEKNSGVLWDDPTTAPGDDTMRLRGVRILSEEGEQIFGADIQKEIIVEVSYWNLREGTRPFISIHVVNSEGITVLTSMNMPSASLISDPWYGKASPKGLFRTICRIPGNFLNDGLYFINAFVATSYAGIIITHVAKERIISFEVVETGGMRKEYAGKWVGVVRPRLAWNTEYQGVLDKQIS